MVLEDWVPVRVSLVLSNMYPDPHEILITLFVDGVQREFSIDDRLEFNAPICTGRFSPRVPKSPLAGWVVRGTLATSASTFIWAIRPAEPRSIW